MVYQAGQHQDPVLCDAHMFTDGSCSRHSVRELARAAWAVVARNQDSGIRMAIGGAVCRPFPQTPQAAEYHALCAAMQCMCAPTQVFSDCSNVVMDANRSWRDMCAPRRMYAGLMKQ
eukprot:3358498-Alexandrium_andersonii.AAC.1